MLKRVDVIILKRVLKCEVEGQKKKERLVRTWKKQVEQESVKAGFRGEDGLCHSM